MNTNPLGHINRDLTGEKTVRKGLTVDYYGLRVLVQCVRKGNVTGCTLVSRETFYGRCSTVKVVA